MLEIVFASKYHPPKKYARTLQRSVWKVIISSTLDPIGRPRPPCRLANDSRRYFSRRSSAVLMIGEQDVVSLITKTWTKYLSPCKDVTDFENSQLIANTQLPIFPP